MRCVVGCPREGPGLRVCAEWRDIMLCYVMYSGSDVGDCYCYEGLTAIDPDSAETTEVCFFA